MGVCGWVGGGGGGYKIQLPGILNFKLLFVENTSASLEVKIAGSLKNENYDPSTLGKFLLFFAK